MPLVILDILLNANLAYSRCSVNINGPSQFISQSTHAHMSEWLRTTVAEYISSRG